MSVADVGSGGEEAVGTFDTITFLLQAGDTMLSFICRFCDFKGKPLISKYNTAVFFLIGHWIFHYLHLGVKHTENGSDILFAYAVQPTSYLCCCYSGPSYPQRSNDVPTYCDAFETEYVVESTLVLNPDLYATKYKDKLEPSYKCLTHEVFTMILRGLSGTKTTRPSSVVVRMVTL